MLTKILSILEENECEYLFAKEDSFVFFKKYKHFAKLEYKLTQEDFKKIIQDIILRYPHLNEKKISEISIPWEVDKKRFRISLYTQKGRYGLVIKRIPRQIPPLEELGLSEALKKMVLDAKGLFLIVGGAGSGKTTLLAALVEYINQNKQAHIISIEDPIEFVFEDKESFISQREIGTDTSSYTSALKFIASQAPDIVVIGEIKDKEGMDACLFFGESGQLVLSTFIAYDTPSAISKILQFYPYQMHESILTRLSMSLCGIVALRLLPSKDTEGRVLAKELLFNTPRIKDLIKRGEITQLKKAIAEGQLDGLETFDQNIFSLYKEGKISYDVALCYVDTPSEFMLKLKTL